MVTESNVFAETNANKIGEMLLATLLAPIFCILACTIYLTPLTPEAKNVVVVEWSSESPNEDRVNAIMDCELVGLPEKSSDRNFLINLAARRGANVLLLRDLKEHSAMAAHTFGPTFEASFYRCPDPAAGKAASKPIGRGPRSRSSEWRVSWLSSARSVADDFKLPSSRSTARASAEASRR